MERVVKWLIYLIITLGIGLTISICSYRQCLEKYEVYKNTIESKQSAEKVK